ncbi:MAG: peptidoglycan DD-metalloendopeptidase family protein [Dehalococcoidia bacterium]|nr:peptidoglycan DD-metalloendopeptidase family protein [Dehalococcoidia bacterium]MDD5494437.1 peptidoglycan DD-metalloendopeptidase family protein [Dehalococcoidia bacterium]
MNIVKILLNKAIIPHIFILTCITLAFLASCMAAPTATAQPTTQPEPAPVVQKCTVRGIVFHDYNGNGVKDGQEPGIHNAKINFRYWSDTTDSDGAYEIIMPPGVYALSVSPPSNTLFTQGFEFISYSTAEYKETRFSPNIEVSENMSHDIGLIQGFLTLPFGTDTKFLPEYPLGILHFVDRKGEAGEKIDWQGGERTYDGHDGTDFFMEEYTPILAAAPGTVIEWPLPYNINAKNVVLIQHERYGWTKKGDVYDVDFDIVTAYGHMHKATVKPGDKVKRGDVIGLSGKSDIYVPLPGRSGLNMPYDGKHLHFSVYLVKSLTPMNINWTDPYQSIVTVEKRSINLWTKFNDPQYPK